MGKELYLKYVQYPPYLLLFNIDFCPSQKKQNNVAELTGDLSRFGFFLLFFFARLAAVRYGSCNCTRQEGLGPGGEKNAQGRMRQALTTLSSPFKTKAHIAADHTHPGEGVR